MKNNVWLAISFSVLAAAATSTVQADDSLTSEQTTKDTSEIKDPSVLINSLKISVKPTFENAVPCYITK